MSRHILDGSIIDSHSQFDTPNSVMSFGIGSYIIYKRCNINYFTSSGVGHHSQKSENNHANGTERARAKSAARKNELIFVWAQLGDFFSRCFQKMNLYLRRIKLNLTRKSTFFCIVVIAFYVLQKWIFVEATNRETRESHSSHTHTKILLDIRDKNTFLLGQISSHPLESLIADIFALCVKSKKDTHKCSPFFRGRSPAVSVS